MKKISTTALSKIIGIPTKELFSKLSEYGLIEKKDDSWELKEEGKK
jgi:hypothetical protein